jgi:signal transduction histidine kinase
MRDECDALRKSIPPSQLRPESQERFAEIEQLIDECSEGVERAIAIVEDMSELSAGGAPATEPLDVNAVLQGVVRMAATQRQGTARIVERYGELPPLTGRAGQLRQVFLNLVVNALQAAGESGTVEVETAAEAGVVRVRVRDDGPGIANEHRERLFEPFFTTKPAGVGTGLGLFLSYQIVRNHGGEIRVTSAPGSGALFEVWLPLAMRRESELAP